MSTITQAQAIALPTKDRTTNPIHSVILVREAGVVKQYELLKQSQVDPTAATLSPGDYEIDINQVIWQQIF